MIVHIFKNCKLLLVSKKEYFKITTEAELFNCFKSTVYLFPSIAKMELIHFERKKEFILGRFLAFELYKELTSKVLIDLEMNDDRSPKWPNNVVGSISHNKEFVGVSLGLKKNFRSIGIDLEDLARDILHIRSKILIDKDIQHHSQFTDSELITFIFSAKESLFKLLHPLVQKYFGFEDAYVSSIDTAHRVFNIHLIRDLDHEFNSENKNIFTGQYEIIESSILTVLIIES